MDYSPQSSSVHEISQARILEWVTIFFSRGSSQRRDWTHVYCLAGGFFTTVPLGTKWHYFILFYCWVILCVCMCVCLYIYTHTPQLEKKDNLKERNIHCKKKERFEDSLVILKIILKSFPKILSLNLMEMWNLQGRNWRVLFICFCEIFTGHLWQRWERGVFSDEQKWDFFFWESEGQSQFTVVWHDETSSDLCREGR